MAMYKSDAQGFLVGEIVKSSHDVLKAQGSMIWREIRAEVKEVARAAGTQTATSARLNQPSAGGPRGPYASAKPSRQLGAQSAVNMGVCRRRPRA